MSRIADLRRARSLYAQSIFTALKISKKLQSAANRFALLERWLDSFFLASSLMAQSIVIQVGQSGNQIGSRFWDLALTEHAFYNKEGLYDLPLSSFFRNCDEGGQTLRPQSRGCLIDNLKARASIRKKL